MRRVTNRTMYLYHVTPAGNQMSIQLQGLSRDYWKEGERGVFLVAQSNIDWAIKHVSARSGFSVHDLIVVKVRVRRSRLSRITWRGCRRGVWRHNGSIHPNLIEEVNHA